MMVTFLDFDQPPFWLVKVVGDSARAGAEFDPIELGIEEGISLSGIVELIVECPELQTFGTIKKLKDHLPIRKVGMVIYEAFPNSVWEGLEELAGFSDEEVREARRAI